jgi:hypothetical protein
VSRIEPVASPVGPAYEGYAAQIETRRAMARSSVVEYPEGQPSGPFAKYVFTTARAFGRVCLFLLFAPIAAFALRDPLLYALDPIFFRTRPYRISQYCASNTLSC